MKTTAAAWTLAALILFLSACSTVQSKTDERALLDVSPSLPLVIFEHCLLNEGISLEEIQQGKIKGRFTVAMEAPKAKLDGLDIAINQTNNRNPGIFTACQDSAKDTFEHLEPRLQKSAGGHAAPNLTYTYTGAIFPVGQVNVSQGERFLKTVRMEISMEKPSNPSARAYRVKFYDPSMTGNLIASQGTILEIQNKK